MNVAVIGLVYATLLNAQTGGKPEKYIYIYIYLFNWYLMPFNSSKVKLYHKGKMNFKEQYWTSFSTKMSLLMKRKGVENL